MTKPSLDNAPLMSSEIEDMHKVTLKFVDEAVERRYLHLAVFEKQNLIFYGAVIFELTAILIDFGALGLGVTDIGVIVRFLITVILFICYYLIYKKDRKLIQDFCENEKNQLRIIKESPEIQSGGSEQLQEDLEKPNDSQGKN